MQVFIRLIIAFVAAATLGTLTVNCSGGASTVSGTTTPTSTSTLTSTGTGTGTSTGNPTGTSTSTSLNTGTATASHDSTTLPVCLGPYSSGRVDGKGVLGPFYKYDGEILQIKSVTIGGQDSYGYARLDTSWISPTQQAASAELYWYVSEITWDAAATQKLSTIYFSDVDPYNPNQNDMVNGGTSTYAGQKTDNYTSPGWKSTPIEEYGIAALNNAIAQNEGFITVLWYYT